MRQCSLKEGSQCLGFDAQSYSNPHFKTKSFYRQSDREIVLRYGPILIYSYITKHLYYIYALPNFYVRQYISMANVNLYFGFD